MKHFNLLKNDINNKFKEILEREISNPQLLEMFEYVLEGGKRLRPILFYCILDSSIDNTYKECKYEMCLALELLHTISLVLDDLPCMDNDDMRRGKPSFHIKYGERQANLFVGIGWYLSIKIIRKCITNKLNSQIKEHIQTCKLILNDIYLNMGMLGACTGQFLDLCPILPGINKKDFLDTYATKEGLMEILNLKTTTIFRLCMNSGYILGKYNFDKKIMNEIGDNFGLAFQIFDDFDDITQDKLRQSDGTFTPNYLLSFGNKEAYDTFNNSINKFINLYKKYIGNNEVINEIYNLLTDSVNTHYKNM